jgi:hypothetical protein
MAEDVTRRTLLAGAGTIAAGAAATGPASAAAKARTVGTVRDDRDAIEVVGRLVQAEDAITGFGYLTHVSGIPDAELFYRGRFQNGLSVIAPEQGLTTVTGDLAQRSAHAFRLGGHRYRLGRAGLRQRLEASGPGRKNTDPSARTAVFEVGGALVVAD